MNWEDRGWELGRVGIEKAKTIYMVYGVLLVGVDEQGSGTG